MRDPFKATIKAVLVLLHYTGLGRALTPLARGRGVIFMLHQVGPESGQGFSPNRILNVTPEFLESVIQFVKREGFDLIGLDDVPARLQDKTARRPFACFTLDDGYRDNIEYAYPIFKRHGVPFAIYLPSAFADGEGDLWWLVLERAIAIATSVDVVKDGEQRLYSTETNADKYAAFNELYWWLRTLPEARARKIVAGMAEASGYDAKPLCRDLVMTWDDARALARDPLVTIGGHTSRHFALAKLSPEDAHREILVGRSRVETELDRPCRHLSYPYGDHDSAGEREFEMAKRFGFATAVTTRKGHIQDSHVDHMTALPRLSLNGEYQDLRYVSALLSGVPFALWSRLSQLRATFARFAALIPGRSGVSQHAAR